MEATEAERCQRGSAAGVALRLILLVALGLALYRIGVLDPLSSFSVGCYGFERLRYQGLSYRLSEGGASDGGQLQLRLLNGAGGAITVTEMEVADPDGGRVAWSSSGFGCERTRVAGNASSGCLPQNVSDGEAFAIGVGGVGAGSRVDPSDAASVARRLVPGSTSSLRVRVTYSELSGLAGHAEEAVCTARLDGAEARGRPEAGAPPEPT